MIFVITILIAKATAEVTHFINACYKALLLKAVFIEKCRRQILSGERNVNVQVYMYFCQF